MSRDLKVPDLELHMFGLVTSANELVAGWRRGRQLGLIKFLASAAKRNAATFPLNGVFRRDWGLEPQASLGRILRAMEDVAEFPSSLHLAAWKIGAWPVLLTGTQTTTSLGPPTGSSLPCPTSADASRSAASSITTRLRAPRKKSWGARKTQS